MTESEICCYRPIDQPALERFFDDAWRRTRFPFDPSGAHADLRRIPVEYQGEGGEFWLLRVDERIVGTVGLRRLSERIAEVKRLNVLPAYRGRGYGDRLLSHALSHAMAGGFIAVRLDTIRILGPAVHLFEKYGFEEIGRYNSNPDADLFMERRLVGSPGP